ncbi:MAG: hypothetical protein HZB37_11940 [Planctomycetes bacterium]|nr:hypothetical protein [Planctomycetota bacterium]
MRSLVYLIVSSYIDDLDLRAANEEMVKTGEKIGKFIKTREATMVKAKDLLLSQLETLAKSTEDLRLYAVTHAPDGWDKDELEMVDAMVNVMIKQGWVLLTTIGGPLKAARLQEEEFTTNA